MRWPLSLVVCGWIVGNAYAHADHTADARTDSVSASPEYHVYADVVGVEPLIRTRTVATPREECHRADSAGTHSQPYYDQRGHGFHYEDHHEPHGSRIATLLGGVIGGLIGNQFGGGKGRTALTVAGAMAGAGMASRATAHRHHQPVVPLAPRYCETVVETREVEEVVGYRVRYRYAGREFEKRVAEHPGERIRVAVQVTPAEPV